MKEIHGRAFAIGSLLLEHFYLLRRHALVRELVAAKKVALVGAVFNPLNGRVEYLEALNES